MSSEVTGGKGDSSVSQPKRNLFLHKTFNLAIFASAAAFAALLLINAPSALAVSNESVIYSFQAQPDAEEPYAPLVGDAKGNLYGTTYVGGTSNCGTVFKVTPAGVETVLYSFSCGADGAYPYFAGVVLDKAGNLYGTTTYGGLGYGVVYQLSPSGVETPLYTFQDGADGGYPFAGVVLDKVGNIYGTTSGGGASGDGTVFKVTPTGTESVIYNFTGGNDGCVPYGSGVIFGPKKTLYGTTSSCGANGYGTVYKVTLSGKETILHSFNYDGTDGAYPYAGVVLDKAGNVYGTTYTGGANFLGTVYEVSSKGVETILHSFNSDGTDGYYPLGAGVVRDKLGNLFGTTSSGGIYGGGGVVFEITSSGSYSLVHSFGGPSPDGASPEAGLWLGKSNTLYGTTIGGGAIGYGAVFKVTY